MKRSRLPGTVKPSTGALLILSSILWGSSFVSIKIGLAYLNAYEFAFLRMAATAAILFAVLLPYRGINTSLFKESSVWALGILNGIGFTLQFVGMLYTTAAKTALLVNMNVIFVAILSWRFQEESFGIRKKLGVIFGVTGAVLVATNGDPLTFLKGDFFGDILVFSAGLIWAFFVVINKNVLSKEDRNVVELSSVVMFVTALTLLPMAVISGSLHPTAISQPGWFLVAFTAVICTALPYLLWLSGLKAVTATIACVIGMLEIVFAMLLSTLLLDETYTTMTLTGAFLVLTSVVAVAET